MFQSAMALGSGVFGALGPWGCLACLALGVVAFFFSGSGVTDEELAQKQADWEGVEAYEKTEAERLLEAEAAQEDELEEVRETGREVYAEDHSDEYCEDDRIRPYRS